MRLVRLALNVFVAGIVIVGSVAAATWLRDRRTSPAGSSADVALTASSASASPRPTASADCAGLTKIAPQPAPALAVTAAGQRSVVTSAQGGYSISVPSTWQISPGYFNEPAFGQAHITSYDPKTIPTPGPEAPGIVPPKYGIRLDIEIWDNAARTPLDQYATTIHYWADQSSIDPGAFMTVDGHSAYRFTVRDEHRFSPAPGQLITTRQTRAVWLIAGPRDDRLVVVYATPIESDLFSSVESAVAAMKITAPVASQVPMTHTRAEVTARWLTDAKGLPVVGRRVEAKLATYREAMMTLSGYMGISRMDRDWDELIWVIAVSGPDLPMGRGGPRGIVGQSGPQPTIAPTTWMLTMAPATNDDGSGTGAAFATQGTWPPRFDDLVDRCR
jgi:hypothetical protein